MPRENKTREMSDNPVETEYYLRLISMYIDLATKSVLNVLYYCKPNEDVSNFLSHPASRKILDKLRLNGVLKPKEYKLVTSTVSDPDKFDIVLLIKLLSSLFPPKVFSPPTNGWRNPPGKSDLSIAADLLRLRNIRNGVLCHRPKAQLSEFYFKHYWAELEEILIRITQQTNPDEVIALTGRLQEYKKRDLGAYDGSQHADLLEDWDQEINEIQTQVEELLKATKEFEAYFKDKPGRYERYIRLVVDGGRLILSAVLEKELKRESLSLPTLLEQKEEYFKSVIRDENSLECLYSTDIAEWDIALIAKVIRHGFEDLKSEDIEDIEAIQFARQNYAETALLSLNSDSLADRREDLIVSLKSLSRGLNKEVGIKLNEIIEVCKNRNEDTCTPETYLDNLRLAGSNIRSLADVHTETISKLKRCLKQMKREGIALKRKHRLELKLLTVDTNGDKAEKAEDDIFRVLKGAIENAVDTNGLPTVRHEINKILNWIGANDGVTKIDTYKHCIIISVTCSTPSAILRAIEICESKAFEHALRNISSEMSVELFETITLNGYFTLESLRRILVCQSENRDEDHGIVIPVTVSSADGLYRVMSLFENRKLTNSASRISESLSSRHGELISVQISHEFNDSDISSSDSNDDISCKNQASDAQVIQHKPLFKETGKEYNENSLTNLEQEIIPQSEDKRDTDAYVASHELESSDTTVYMESEYESSKPESSTRQSEKDCPNRQDASEKNQDFSADEKQLVKIPSRLNILSSKLKSDSDIKTQVDSIAYQAKKAARSFSSFISKEGSAVLVQKALFMTSEPETVCIADMQSALNNETDEFTATRDLLVILQAHLHSTIETCRSRKVSYKAELDTILLKMTNIRTDIESLELTALTHENDAATLDVAAAELNKQADDEKAAAEKKRKDVETVGIVGGIVGLALAPFTAGISLALGAAATGISAAVSLPSAFKCEKKASRLRNDSERKRKKVEEIKTDMKKLLKQRSALESNMRQVRLKIDSLTKTCDVLQQVTSFLLPSIEAINVLLSAFQDMDIAFYAASLQNNAFERNQNVFLRQPEHSQRCSLNYLDELKEKWEQLEEILL